MVIYKKNFIKVDFIFFNLRSLNDFVANSSKSSSLNKSQLSDCSNKISETLNEKNYLPLKSFVSSPEDDMISTNRLFTTNLGSLIYAAPETISFNYSKLTVYNEKVSICIY